MKPIAIFFAILTAGISVNALEIEHHDHDHTNPPHQSITRRSNHIEHHTSPESDHAVASRDLLLEFSTRELVEELEARIKDAHYNHVERRDPGRFTNWVRKQAGKITGGGGHGGAVVDDGMGGAGATSDMGVTGP